MEQGDWISVEEKYPEVDREEMGYSDDVLVYTDESKMFVAYLVCYKKCAHRTQETFHWRVQETGCGCCSYNPKVTHWMPLPKPPEER